MRNRVKFLIIAMLVMQIYLPIEVYADRVGPMKTRLAYAVSYTPKTDIFRFKQCGDEFILLDYNEDGFFVTTKNFYGTHVYDPNGTSKFDIYDENNIAYWLNNDFLLNGNDMENGGTTSIPDVIMKHIKEHDWVCEAGSQVSDFPEDYIVRAKLALMSLTEYKKYADKIGTDDNLGISTYYFLRTVNGTETNSPILVMYPSGTVNSGKEESAYGVRPVFYLERDVFIKDKIDVSNTGEHVKKKLQEVYSKEELKKVYSSYELEDIYKKVPPQVTDITISGIQQAGKKLTLKYKYQSLDGEPEGETIIRWMRSRNKNGPYGVVRGANKTEYTMTNNDTGYYFICEVVPVSKSGCLGYAKRSMATSTVVRGTVAPYAEGVSIKGDLLVGKRLIASYKYIDNNDSLEQGTVVKWQKSMDKTNYEDIEGETSANLMLSAECSGYYIRCIVTVHNEMEAGAAVISEPVGPVASIPEKINPIIENNNGNIILNTEVGEKDKVIWLTKTDNKVGISQIGGKSYAIDSNESEVKLLVIRYSENGIVSGMEMSNVVNMDVDYMEFDVQNSVEINGEQVEVISDGNQLGHSMKIVLHTQDVSIKNLQSDEYNIYSYTEDDKVICVLTKKKQMDSKIPERILIFDTEGQGNITIESREAVYETELGVIEKYEPKISLVGGMK